MGASCSQDKDQLVHQLCCWLCFFISENICIKVKLSKPTMSSIADLKLLHWLYPSSYICMAEHTIKILAIHTQDFYCEDTFERVLTVGGSFTRAATVFSSCTAKYCL